MPGIIQNQMPDDDNAVAGYQAERINMDPRTDTVEGRVEGIIAKNSPLMQQAATRGKQGAARSGLLNSSMAVGAAHGAVMDRATPIASQDANASLQTKALNQQAGNAASQFNAGTMHARQMQGADFDGRSRLQREAGNIETGLIGTRADAESRLIGDRASAESRLIGDRTDAEARLIGDRTDAESRLQGERAQQAERLAQIDRETQEILQNLRGDQAERLAEIEGQNRLLVQSSQSAAVFYSQVSASMSEILANPDIPQAQKQSLINRQLDLLNNGLTLIGGIADNDFGGVLDFGSGGGGTGGGTMTPPPDFDYRGILPRFANLR